VDRLLAQSLGCIQASKTRTDNDNSEWSARHRSIPSASANARRARAR
jgi:hypothetical protein